MTPEELERGEKGIDNLSQEDMARLWRFAPSGHPYFDRTNPLSGYFNVKFKGFTPEISKNIGW